MTCSEVGFLLTIKELEDLSGYSKPSAQARWLEQNGLPFLIGGDGRLKVLRQVVEQRLGAPPDEKKREPQLRFTRPGEVSRRKRRPTEGT